MADDRRTTLSRLSKLQLEIQQLTDTLNQPPSRTSSKYGQQASSVPMSAYEVEAKYMASGSGSVEYGSAGRASSDKPQSWSSDRSSGSSSRPSRTSSYKMETDRSSYKAREAGYSSGSSSRGDFGRGGAGRSTGQSGQGSFSGSGTRLKAIEDKYLHCAAPSVLSQPRPGLLPTPTAGRDAFRGGPSSRGSSRGGRQGRGWVSPANRGKFSSSRSTLAEQAAKSTPPARTYGSDHKPSRGRYTWRHSDDARPRFRSDAAASRGFRSPPAHRTFKPHEDKSHSAGRDSSRGRHYSAATAQSKYRFDSRSSSASHGTHRHHLSSSTASSSRSATLPGPSTTKSPSSLAAARLSRSKPEAPSSYSSSKPRPRTLPSSSPRSYPSLSSSSRDYHSRRDSGHLAHRSYRPPRFRGAVTSRGFSSVRSHHHFTGTRGRGFLSSRARAFPIRRGRGVAAFRGRGSRGYYVTRARGYFPRARGSFYRGRVARHLVSSRDWKSSHRSSYRHKDSALSSSRKSPERSFHSRYALRKWQDKAGEKKPLSFMEKRRQAVLSNTPLLLRSRYALVKGHRHHRPSSAMTVRAQARRSSETKRLVTVKKTRTKLIRATEGKKRPSGSLVTLRGDQFKLRINRFSKALYRLPSSGKAAGVAGSEGAPSSSEKREKPSSRGSHKLVLKSSVPSITRQVASQVLQRSIYTSLAAKRRLKKQASSKQYCMFFNLYGRCKRGNDCPYIHDPQKVAVCTRFLRGTCPRNDGSCPFSHQVSKEKMPVCSYFLRGVCNRDGCPYSHVKVSSTALICPDFVKGYCPLGAKCKKKHVLRCAEFSKTGQCENGKQCPLLHKKEVAARSKATTQTSSADKRAVKPEETETRTPAKRPKTAEGSGVSTPSFIQLDSADKLKTAPSTVGDVASVSPSPDLVAKQQSVAEDDGAAIVPSFVKLSSGERAKERAPSSGTTEIKSEEGETSTEEGSAPTAPSIRDAGLSGAKPVCADAPRSRPPHRTQPSRGCRGQRASAEVDGDAGEATAPSLSAEDEQPTASRLSFIKLHAEGTLDEAMEDASAVTNQESKSALQIRPQFTR